MTHVGETVPPTAGRGPVKSASRTIDVLELLADAAGPLSLSQIARGLDVPKSSLHGLLQTLADRGWVETGQRGLGYSIGLRALRVGGALLDGDPMVQIATVLLSKLGSDLDETVHLARLDVSDVVYLVTRESQHHLRVSSRIGRRLPAHATSLGKALLAQRPWEEVEDFLPETLPSITPFTVATREALRTELAETRVRGWATEVDQTTVGLTCFGVTVPSEGPPMNALSCAIPGSRVTDEHARVVVDGLMSCASELALLARHSR